MVEEILKKIERINKMHKNLESKNYLVKWCAIMDLEIQSEHVYCNKYFTIKVYSDYINVYDNITNEVLLNYKDFWRDRLFGDSFDYSIANDKYIVFLLIKIISCLPEIQKRKEELSRFNQVKNNNLICIPLTNIKIFEINYINVFKYHHSFEQRYERVRQDDLFYYHLDERWLIEYKGIFIIDEFLESLLPENTITENGSFYDGYKSVENEIKTYRFDSALTKKLISCFENRNS